jgi:hypothetical protein
MNEYIRKLIIIKKGRVGICVRHKNRNYIVRPETWPPPRFELSHIIIALEN